ncbi:nuA3 HAT complex component nto1 [Pleurotus ostreatus]|uniref:NuA3 HAT complex component nto1 n=1 Tax=Pleurotus ostreatus TaxID=5322 RepID=A0A8H7DUH2_PLEOS|nr:nuA3 HAT complex component nto1 [Pleurotus ostreatus]KAF7431134.1 nuA3 HAT complex component nto1 [Pleurotus ostreatus]
MARGIRHSPAENTTLPKVQFEKVDDLDSTRPGGVHDQQARSYGYNDFSEFSRPEYYIRYIEPLESELATQVEYDMDEQDQEWLDHVNQERKKEQLDKATYELFEIVMDRLEKEWFDLTKNIPKPDLAMPSEDSTCAICDDSEGENSNAIVFCDGCNLAVHQDCYGVPYIPEGQWLCRKCTVSPENPVSCILCPNEGGAFKQTVHGEWVHLLCAIWVPETRVANDVFMEPITGIERISKQRWRLRCSICDIKQGACIQCAKTSCFLAFHATCARKEKLLLPMKSQPGAEPISLTSYCERHLPKEQQDARIAALAAEESNESDDDLINKDKHTKSARAYAKTFKTGPPLVPSIIVERILQYVAKIHLRKKPEFVYMMCRYWSLKREARRGAPLLKRLHLEPWTANAGLKPQSDEEKLMKLQLLQRLRDDLENVRALAELTRKREARKRKQVELIHNVISQFLLSHEPTLRMAFERIMSSDRNNYFKNPVSKNDVPDYFDVVKEPMCWSMIDAKLDRHEYLDVQRFKDDIDLVLSNAILYNKPGTAFYKTATRIRASARPILDELDKLCVSHTELATGAPDLSAMTVDESSSPLPPLPLGDLEPPLTVLEMLVTDSGGLQEGLPFLLEEPAITSLFRYEFGKDKPPPPPPPPKPKKTKVKPPKKDRAEEYEKRRLIRQQQKEAAAVSSPQDALLDQSPGFRIPRTRKQAANAAAFEAEATAEVSVETEGTELQANLYETPGPSSKKRAPRAQVGQLGQPQWVEDVDSRSSFALFENGWILPEGSRRGGRDRPAAAPVVAPTPPTKRNRAGHEVSRLSVYSTSAHENQTLLDNASESQGSRRVSEIVSTISESPTAQPSSMDYDVSLALKDRIMLPSTIVREPDGTVVIEELDTPATRSEKNKRLRAERMRLAGPGVPPPTPFHAPPPDISLLAGAISRANQRSQAAEKPESDDESSSLSELSSDGDGRDQLLDIPPMRVVPNLPPLPPPVQVSPADFTEGLRPGTIASYPWWPATIRDKSDVDVPKQLLKDSGAKRKDEFYIVQFFDPQYSWQSVVPENVKLFNVDKSLDEKYLHFKGKLSAKLRAAFREASNVIEYADAGSDDVLEGDDVVAPVES